MKVLTKSFSFTSSKISDALLGWTREKGRAPQPLTGNDRLRNHEQGSECRSGHERWQVMEMTSVGMWLERNREQLQEILYIFFLLLETEILMKKIPSNGFSKWLYKYNHSSFRISR